VKQNHTDVSAVSSMSSGQRQRKPDVRMNSSGKMAQQTDD